MKKILHNSFRKSSNYTRNLEKLLSNYGLFRDKHFSNECLKSLALHFPDSDLWLTHSATGALEMIAILLDIKPGDEIIMPSFTFVSTANAFVLMGATPVFVDILPYTLCINPKGVELAISDKTKAIVGVHYGGTAFDINKIQEIAKKHNIPLIEDAAMGFGARHNGKSLGSFGDFAVVSFDITKHISGIQGGLLIINNSDYKVRASQVYHNGTNREAFQEGKISHFEWVDKGSKYQMTETNAVILLDQLEDYEQIISYRKSISNSYQAALRKVNSPKLISYFKSNEDDNGHVFYLILKDETTRNNLKQHLASEEIEALSHYIPLHSSKYGKLASKNNIAKDVTTTISKTILRLPLHTEMDDRDVERVCSSLKLFFND